MSKRGTTVICAGLSGLVALSAVWLTQPASADAGSRRTHPRQAGFASAAPDRHLVVTGGTGRFARAAGRATLTEFGKDTGSLVIHLAQPS